MRYALFAIIIISAFCRAANSQVPEKEERLQGNVSLLIQSNDPVCVGQQLTLTAYGIQDNTCVIAWTGPSGQSFSGKHATFPYANMGMNGWWTMDAVCDGYSVSDKILVKIYPVVTATITPDSATFCEGGLTVLFANPAGLLYHWSNGSRTRSITVNRPGIYSCYVYVPGGACGGNTPNCIVTILPKPKALIKALGPTSFCEGDSVELEAFPKENIDYYSWSTGEQKERITVRKSGIYELFVTDSNGCKGNATINISTEGLLVGIRGDSVKCRGESIALEALPDEEDFSYLWSTGDTTRIISVSEPGTYIVNAENKKGCKGDAAIRVDFAEPPVVSIKALGNTSFCRGGGVKLEIENFDPSLKYYWSNGSKESDITVTESGIFYLTAYDSLGCFTADSIEITVFPNPTPEIATFSNDRHCAGDTIIIGTKLPYSEYLWNMGDTSRYISVIKTGFFEVFVTDSNGCRGRSAIDIFVKPKPDIDIKANGPVSFCKGDSVALSAIDKRGDVIAYKWSTGETTPVIIVSESGEYALIAENSAGCFDSASIAVTVYPEPAFEITGRSKFCGGESTILQPDREFAEYLWSNGSRDKSITVSAPGIYTLEVKDENGCKGYAEFQADTFNFNISYSPFNDFGKFCVNEQGLLEIEFFNNGAERILVEGAMLSGSEKFTFAGEIQNAYLAPHAKLQIPVNFSSSVMGNYRTDLEISITEPCIRRYIAVLTASAMPIISVWLPDTVAQSGNPSLCIPVYARLDYVASETLQLDYSGEIQFEASIFYPQEIVNSRVENGLRKYRIEGWTNLSAEPTVLQHICGAVLLDRSAKTKLEINAIEWSEPDICLEIKNGSLERVQICIEDLRLVTMYYPAEIEVTVSIAESANQLTVKSGEKGAYSLEIYSLSGVKLFGENWISTGYYEKQFYMNYDNYASGVYMIVLKTPMRILTKIAPVLK